MFLVVLKKKIIMEFIYCRRLKSQYFGAPKSGTSKMRGLPAVASIAGGVPTPLAVNSPSRIQGPRRSLES